MTIIKHLFNHMRRAADVSVYICVDLWCLILATCEVLVTDRPAIPTPNRSII